jgi:hypothetical protein
MHEYECKCPLEVLDTCFYPNLRKDRSGRIVSENITFFTLRRYKSMDETLTKILKKMESEVRGYCPGAEVVYCDVSGNRWVFLLLNGNPSKGELVQMQKAYKEVYDSTFMRWRI